jgi:hypothetical protein
LPSEFWVMMRCPRHECGKPFFAVFEEPPFDLGANLNRPYKFAYATPWSAQKTPRHADIEAISPDFYEIFDQASAAEQYRLPLIAGAGYRKALEYLVKDYVLAPYPKKFADAEERGDTTEADRLRAEAKSILDRNLGGKNGVIALIHDAKLQKVAERAIWLGNDEVHYTRKWTTKDVEDLKRLISMVANHIADAAEFERLMADMPDGGPPANVSPSPSKN